jgi:hypothetical protein
LGKQLTLMCDVCTSHSSGNQDKQYPSGLACWAVMLHYYATPDVLQKTRHNSSCNTIKQYSCWLACWEFEHADNFATPGELQKHTNMHQQPYSISSI